MHTSQALEGAGGGSPAGAKTSGIALNHGLGWQPLWILVGWHWVSPAANLPQCSALITWRYRQHARGAGGARER